MVFFEEATGCLEFIIDGARGDFKPFDRRSLIEQVSHVCRANRDKK